MASGLLWGGAPNRILRWARDGSLELLACEETAAELKRVIQHSKLSSRLNSLSLAPADVLAYAMNLVRFVPSPDKIPDVIRKDVSIPDERYAARLIISGDHHLLELKQHLDIPIATPAEATEVVRRLGDMRHMGAT